MSNSPSAVVSLLAGGIAGTAVDVSLYPLDTIKTRLQASRGFLANGGWSGIYRGIGSVVAGSAPSAAIFFLTYDRGKALLAGLGSEPLQHMMSASVAEVMSCLVRVPVEVIKQRTQANLYQSSWDAMKATFRKGELYRGFRSTIMREIPFTVIQFPLWELLKAQSAKRWNGDVPVLQSAIYGSVAGAVAATLTTPLDVLKTRIMVNPTDVGLLMTASQLLQSDGIFAFWRGVVPRVVWISFGGAIFLGAYDGARSILATWNS